MLLTVLNHPLKIGSVVRCTALCPVDVLADDGVLMGLGVLVADLQLALDRLLRLGVTGEAGIDDYIHFVTSCIVFYSNYTIQRLKVQRTIIDKISILLDKSYHRHVK